MHILSIREIKRETPNCITIELDVPENLKEQFLYQAGQYLSIEVDLSGQIYRREYSICSAPHEESLRFSVKRVPGGKVSNWLNADCKAGDSLKVFPPNGRFIVTPNPDSRLTYYFIGSGSGITPLFSMIKTILECEPLSTVYLIYGNSTREEVIYGEELRAMNEKYADQFQVQYIFSQMSNWTGKKGRIDQGVIAEFLRTHPKATREERFFICGPGNMIETVEAALLELDVYSGDILKEYFVNDKKELTTDMNTDLSGLLHVVLNGEEIRMEWDQKNSILDNLLEAGYDPPFSCQSGICTTCIGKVLEGEVTTDNQLGLTKRDVEEGYCLTCQAKPKTSFVSVDYDNI